MRGVNLQAKNGRKGRFRGRVRLDSTDAAAGAGKLTSASLGAAILTVLTRSRVL